MQETHLRQAAAFATLTGLVQCFSPSGQERAAVTWLVNRMQVLGYQQAFIDGAGNAVGVIGDGSQQIVLLGHIDTVSGEIPVQQAGEVLYGRGAVDAKGPLAAFVDAAAKIGPVPGWQFVVIGAVEEERDSLGARYVVGRYRPAFAIIGEPSHWERITLGYKGSAWAEVCVRLPLAHTAGRQKSASESLIETWETIRSWIEAYNAHPGRERVFEQLLPTLRGLASGEDGFEEWASLRLGVRLPPDMSPEAWYVQLGDLAAGAELHPLGFAIPAYQAEKNTALVRAFLAGIRAASGNPGFVVKSGTADINIVAPAWGCPAVAYGPGDSNLDHTPNEHISLADYARSVEVLQAVLKRLTSAG